MQRDQVITIRGDALADIVRQTIKLVQLEGLSREEDKWVSPERAKEILQISSNSYLSYLRCNGMIEYSQPSKKHIVYNRFSLIDYLESAKQKQF